ncbi:MAG: LysR family transcriptional regulator [Spirochaetaceae bacterium]|nr:MAG: LysR family transcriptional regulator [Spirochaetaceae bacterium]
MDVVKFRAFYTVARLKNISKAAEQLYYTQPAVSAQIRELENSYGTRLFKRVGQRLELTEAGAELFPYAERLLNMFEESVNVVHDVSDAASRLVRIGASSMPGVHLVPALMAEFRAAHADNTFSLRIANAARIEQLLVSAEVDVAILGRPARVPKKPHFTEVLLLKDPMVAVVSHQHDYAGRSSLELADLSDQPFILPSRDFLTRKAVEERLRGLNLVFNLAFEVSNTEAIKRMVIHNLGMTIMCASMVATEASCGWLESIPVSGLNLHRNVYLAYHTQETIAPAQQQFIDFVVTRYRSSSRQSGKEVAQ